MNSSVKAHISLLTANLIYGANYTIAKLVMPDYIKPFGFILLRVTGALILFWIVSSIFIKEKVERKDFPRLMLLGLFGVAINQMLFFKGLSITTPINASIMMICSPILVLIAASFLLNEKITYTKFIGILLGFVGAGSLLLLKDDLSIGSHTAIGDLYIFINAISWSIYLVLVKPLMMKYNTFTIVKWVFLFGLIYVFPFCLSEFNEIKWNDLPQEIWLSIAFVVIGSTFFAYILNTYALKALSPSVVSAYIYLQPFLAALIAIALLKDELSYVKIISGLFIFMGVYLVSQPNNKVKN